MTYSLKKALIVLSLIILLGVFAVLIGGSLRYGSVQGLVLRLRAEIAAGRPAEHPVLVPTPLPTPTLSLAQPTPGGGDPPVAPTSIGTPSPVASSSSSTPIKAVVTPTPTATPTLVFRRPADSVELAGLVHYWQTWNNCGPATLAMQLSYFGSDLGQEFIRKTLRPNREDKNVSPDELVAFAQVQGYHAVARVAGDVERLQTLISNDIPVLIETWLVPEPNDGMGHYRLLTGYDNASAHWISFDSYISRGVDPDKPYRGITVGYDEISKLWPVFNRTYVVIYTDEQAPLVEAILGDDLDDEVMWQRALAQAWAEVSQASENAFAWFNLGTDLVALEQYEEAAAAYDRARQLGLPWRMLWYQFGPFEAYYEAGRYQEVLALADATLRTTEYVEELHYWRGMALQALGDLPASRQAFQKAIAMKSNYEAAISALDAMNAQSND